MTAEEPSWTVRSAERAQVVLPVRVRARVRLEKHVVTEEVTQTVTVRREELRVVEDSGDPPGADLSWTYQFAEDDDDAAPDLEIVLHAEQVVISTVVVPVERVHVRRRVVGTEVRVTAELRTEQVELETDGPQVGTTEHSTTGAAAGGAPRDEETPA